MENHGVFAAFGAFRAFCSTPERCLPAGCCMAYEGENSGKACQAFLISLRPSVVQSAQPLGQGRPLALADILLEDTSYRLPTQREPAHPYHPA